MARCFGSPKLRCFFVIPAICVVLLSCDRSNVGNEVGPVRSDELPDEPGESVSPLQTATNFVPQFMPVEKIEDFSGSWSAHSIAVDLASDGSGTALWRTYNDCRVDPPPCDRFEGDDIHSGGMGTFKVNRIEGGVGIATVTSTTQSDTFGGTVRLRLDKTNGVLSLEPWQSEELLFCRDKGPFIDGVCA